jgi:hypothetical protein
MFWSRDRVAFDLQTCSNVTRAVEVPPSERAARAERCPRQSEGGATVQLDAAQVRALFEGSELACARRVATLNATQFRIIFGCSADERRRAAPHYRAAVVARRIGIALAHPIVVEALWDQPQWVLLVAARETDPEQQIRAAAQAYVDRANARALRGG